MVNTRGGIENHTLVGRGELDKSDRGIYCRQVPGQESRGIDTITGGEEGLQELIAMHNIICIIQETNTTDGKWQ